MARQRRDETKQVIEKARKEAVNQDNSEEKLEALDQIESFFNSNSSWDDLKELYQTSALQLTNNFENLVMLYNTAGLLQFLEADEASETKVLFEGIQKDFEKMARDLASIYEKHKDYTGAVKDEKEMVMSIEIFEAYGNYTVQYDAIISPTFVTLIERGGRALSKQQAVLQAEQQQIMDQDISIVKDVEFREVTPTEPVPTENQEKASDE